MIFKSYPKYIPCSIQWFTEIPQGWKEVRVEQYLLKKDENIGSLWSSTQLLSLTQKGVVEKDINDGKGKTHSDYSTYQAIDNGDLVFCLFDIDETPRTVGLSTKKGMITSAYTAFKSKENINTQYVYYFFESLDDAKALKPYYKGLRKTVRPPEFLKIHVPFPPKVEQVAISQFLDTETARIDTLIAKQEKLIELLEEQRKSIISHAVTKGLNPNAPMKDSGVEWLGEVPEHWEIYPIGYSFDLLKNNNVGDDWEHTQLLSLTLQGVIKKDINEAKGKTHSDYSTYQQVNVGDFIFCLFDIEETPRTVGVVETSGMITSAYTALKPKPFINPKYFYYFFECRDDLKAFGSEYSGLRKTIRPTKFIKLKICYPKLNEQCEIVGFLDTKCKKIDLLISKQQQLIKKLKEYRISIISHAVTGKIDVREFGA